MEYIKNIKGQLVVAIPSKNPLKNRVISYLKSRSFNVQRSSDRILKATIKENPYYTVVFVNPKDIPFYIQNGIVDVGFTSQDLIFETNVKIRPVININASKVEVNLLVPKDIGYNSPMQLLEKNIATSLPRISKKYFEKLHLKVNIIKANGSLEILPYLKKMADAVIDIVDTGFSAKEHDLKIIDTIFSSSCVCAVNMPELQGNHKLINQFLRKL